MYKILSIVLLMVTSSAIMAQKDSGKHFIPKPLKVPGIDENSSTLFKTPVQPNKVIIGKLREFILSNGDVVRQMSPDNMPCLVPGKDNIAAIPNAFSSPESLPYMPNSMRLHKKSPSREKF